MKKNTFILVVLFIFIALLIGLNINQGKASEGGAEYRVLRVIDGDTIEVEKLGKVRYIGINTPEIKRSSRGPEPFGREACEANKRLVENKTVKLELDVAERDKYGRILAYVYVGKIFVNAWLVENGYARTMTYQPNVKYANLYVKLERKARKSGKGLWGYRKG